MKLTITPSVPCVLGVTGAYWLALVSLSEKIMAHQSDISVGHWIIPSMFMGLCFAWSTAVGNRETAVQTHNEAITYADWRDLRIPSPFILLEFGHIFWISLQITFIVESIIIIFLWPIFGQL